MKRILPLFLLTLAACGQPVFPKLTPAPPGYKAPAIVKVNPGKPGARVDLAQVLQPGMINIVYLHADW